MGVIINNQNTKILGFALKTRPIIPSAEKKYETIEVEGRNGALTRFLNYEDLKFKLTFNILFQTDIKQKLREIKGLMSQAKTLSFDDAPNFYYRVKQAHLSDTESIIKSSGVFSVEFVADSFEYEASSVLEPVYPNLNLLDGTKDFSGTWSNSSSWVTDGTYKGLTVKKRTGQWNGIYKTFIAPKDGTYTFSAYVKGSGNTANVYRYNAINSVSNGTIQKLLGNNFDWTRDSVTLNLKANDSVWIRYEISGAGTDSILLVAGYKWEEGSIATPYMLSKNEEYTNTAKFLIRNNTTYFSQPIIKIFGEGNIKLTVNNELIEFKNVMDGIVLDSELQEAYYNDINKNSQMVGNFPKFEIGENEIICTGKVDKMQILPNWRWLT